MTGPLAVPTPQPSETCDPQPITEAPFALPTEQPSPYSEGTMLGRLLTDAERERLRDAEETVRRLTAERDALRAAAAFDLVASRDALRCIRELEAEVATLSRRLLAARDLEGDMRREIIEAYEQGRITTLDVLRLPHTQPEAELARQRETAYALGQRDAWMAVASTLGLEVTDCLSEVAIRKELARLRGATAR